MRTKFILLTALMALLPNLVTGAEFVLASGSAGSTKWEVTSPFSPVPNVGFVPITVTATSSDPSEITATYQLDSDDYYYGRSSTNLMRESMKLPSRTSVTATHWIWRGSGFKETYGQTYLRFEISTPKGSSSDTLESREQGGSCLGVSQSLTGAGGLKLGANGSIPGSSQFATKVDLKSLPADWRAFSSLHTLMIRASDWDSLSPGMRDAMRVWIGFGGRVRVSDVNPAEIERVNAEILPVGAPLGVFANASPIGGFALTRIASEANTVAGFTDSIFSYEAPEPVSRRRNQSRNYYYDQDEYGSSQAGDFPMADAFGTRDVPYFLICMLLIVFAILVGPISLKLWAGPGRRHRLFFTTPIFSLATSGLMLVLMFFQDGLGIDGRRMVVLDLAPANSSQPNALIYQEQFSRAGMIGGGGFKLEDGLIPIAHQSNTDESLTVKNGQAEGEWFSSRNDRSMVLAGSVPVRWKLTHEGIQNERLTLRIESPLTNFEEAWYVDENNRPWVWDNQPPDADGNMVFLIANSKTSNVASLMKPMFSRGSKDLRDTLLRQASAKNQNNRFWARVEDGAAAAQPSRPKINWKETGLILTSKVTPKNQL